MLDMWDTQSAVITEGSGSKDNVHEKSKKKIRKGAQMVTMHCWHPDIAEFITVKQTPGRLTKFNMSVLVTDTLMEAVKNNKPFNLEFPDYEKHPEEYKTLWDGNIDKWKLNKLSTKIFKSYENANELWDMIMESTYNRNEPGVLFIDTINRLNNLYYCEDINATNPCVTGDTRVLTTEGHQLVTDLVGRKFTAIVDGEEFDSTDQGFWSTGMRDVYEVTLKNGMSIKTTDNHKFVMHKTDELRELRDLKVGDFIKISNSCHPNLIDIEDGSYLEGYFCGQLIGDGTFTTNKYGNQPVITMWIDTKKFPEKNDYEPVNVIEDLIKNISNKCTGLVFIRKKGNISEYRGACRGFVDIAKKYNILPREKRVPFGEGTEFNRGLIQGFFDADGSVQKSVHGTINVRLAQSDLDRLTTIQLLLIQFNISSTIYKNRRKGCYRDMPDGQGGMKKYYCKPTHELVVMGESVVKYQEHIGFVDPCKREKLSKYIEEFPRLWAKDRHQSKIVNIEKLDKKQETFDCTIPIKHLFGGNGISVLQCGEQILPIGGVCLLGSINLTQFIDENNNWDFYKLDKYIPIIVRFLDNVNDITKVPLDIQRLNVRDKRRIGMGILGYASALMMMKTRYGSDKALRMTDELMKFVANHAYRASVELAREKGSFPVYDKNKYLQSNFLKALDPETVELISQYGIRNSHLLSIQPTGNSSVYANNVSGGLEPIFMTEYTRTTTMPYPPEGLYPCKNIDWINRKCTQVGDTKWNWTKEGDVDLLWTEFRDYVWKIDKSRGLLRETNVEDYAVRYLKKSGEWSPNADWVATTTNLTIDEHVNTMKIFAKYVDSAMSKTVNIPNNYSYKSFKKIYRDVYDTGIVKGITTYRAGTMTAVLSEINKPSKIVKNNAPDRPKELDCDVHSITYKKVKHIVLVGLMGNDPYEIFSFKEKGIKFTPKLKKGRLIKDDKGKYNLETDLFTIENLPSYFDSCEEEALTRMISASLRHGADITYIYRQLQKSKGSIVSFAKVISRALSKYVKKMDDSVDTKCVECGDPNGLVFQEGCMMCKNCSYSKCS